MEAQGTWAEANPAISQLTHLAIRSLTLAVSEMDEPHDQAEGCTVLEGLLAAQNEIGAAISRYLEQ